MLHALACPLVSATSPWYSRSLWSVVQAISYKVMSATTSPCDFYKKHPTFFTINLYILYNVMYMYQQKLPSFFSLVVLKNVESVAYFFHNICLIMTEEDLI
jgi:hypothetical protein